MANTPGQSFLQLYHRAGKVAFLFQFPPPVQFRLGGAEDSGETVALLVVLESALVSYPFLHLFKFANELRKGRHVRRRGSAFEPNEYG
jgi:hypothetical protein